VSAISASRNGSVTSRPGTDAAAPSPALAAHPNVIATPHIGGLTLPAVEHQALETVDQLAALRGETRSTARPASACM
jgi:phosphoglycerate dehydrogenase-like enzyme